MSHVSTRKAQGQEVRGTQHGRGGAGQWAGLCFHKVGFHLRRTDQRPTAGSQGEPRGSDTQIPQPLIFYQVACSCMSVF